MLRCPYCRSALTETSASCPQCQLDLARANAVMGPIPRLSADGLTDLAGVLEPSDTRRLHLAMRNFNRHFPQSRILLVVCNFSDQFPLSVHLFWLFNTAGLSGQSNKHGQNRDILIGVDPAGRRAGLTVGYGLEPFLGQDALDHILECSLPHFAAGRLCEGVLDLLSGISRLFEGVVRDLPETFGLDECFAVEERDGEY